MGCVRIRKKSDRLWDTAWRFRSQFRNAKGGPWNRGGFNKKTDSR